MYNSSPEKHFFIANNMDDVALLFLEKLVFFSENFVNKTVVSGNTSNNIVIHESDKYKHELFRKVLAYIFDEKESLIDIYFVLDRKVHNFLGIYYIPEVEIQGFYSFEYNDSMHYLGSCNFLINHLNFKSLLDINGFWLN